MVKKYYKDWKNFKEGSLEFLAQNFFKSRVTFKYRNKFPSYGKLYLTNDNKSFYIKLTKKNDIDKIEEYFKNILYMMANKPIEKEEEKKTDVKIEGKEIGAKEGETVKQKESNDKKKSNKNKKGKKGKK